jgi:hypothetical protein
LKFTKALDGFANRKGALACFGVYLWTHEYFLEIDLAKDSKAGVSLLHSSSDVDGLVVMGETREVKLLNMLRVLKEPIMVDLDSGKGEVPHFHCLLCYLNNSL